MTPGPCVRCCAWPSPTRASASSRPRTASTGWRSCRPSSPDVIVTDINMPRMDGFGFIEDVRADQRYRAIPILVLTTESDAEKKNRARDGRGHRLDRQALQSRQAGRRHPPRRRLSRYGPPVSRGYASRPIKDTFFQECEEQLAELESGLLALEGGDGIPRPSTPSSARCTRSRAAPARSAWKTWSASPTSSRPRWTRCARAAWRSPTTSRQDHAARRRRPGRPGRARRTAARTVEHAARRPCSPSSSLTQAQRRRGRRPAARTTAAKSDWGDFDFQPMAVAVDLRPLEAAPAAPAGAMAGASLQAARRPVRQGQRGRACCCASCRAWARRTVELDATGLPLAGRARSRGRLPGLDHRPRWATPTRSRSARSSSSSTATAN